MVSDAVRLLNEKRQPVQPSATLAIYPEIDLVTPALHGISLPVAMIEFSLRKALFIVAILRVAPILAPVH